MASPTIAAASRFRSAGFFDCLAITNRLPALEAASCWFSRRPNQTVEQSSRRHVERASELDQRVDPGETVAALKLADLGPVKLSGEPKLFLRQTRSETQPEEVLGETVLDAHQLSSRWQWKAAGVSSNVFPCMVITP